MGNRVIRWNIPGAPISEEGVKALEKRLGHELPADYRAFLLEYNGGQPTNEFEVFSIGKDDTSLNSFYSLGDPISARNLEKNWERRREDTEWFAAPDLLPIGYDGFGSEVCLVIAGDKRGEVWFFDTLDPHDPKLWLPWYDRKRDFKRLAGSFSEFLDMLRPNEYMLRSDED